MANTKEYYINGLPAYIDKKLSNILQDWLRTEKQAHKEGNLSYSAIDRMRDSLVRSIDKRQIDGALQNMGNYKWYDYYLGVAGKGLMLNEQFKIELTDTAIKAIGDWVSLNLED